MSLGTVHVLFAEDDERLASFTSDYLSERRVVITRAVDGELALRELAAASFDAVLLDIMLPGRDGFSVCRAIRERSDIPIILLTARGEESDRVLGLELGADDYVVKPFSPRELLARLHAVVRRYRGELAPRPVVLRVGPLSADPSSFTATLEGREISLSAGEFQLLARLMERPGRVLTRDQLLELLTGSCEDSFDRAIDVQISRLRSKLGEQGHALIRTIRGVGYMLVVGGR